MNSVSVMTIPKCDEHPAKRDSASQTRPLSHCGTGRALKISGVLAIDGRFASEVIPDFVAAASHVSEVQDRG